MIALISILGLICIAVGQTSTQTAPAATTGPPEHVTAPTPAHGVPAEGPFFPPSYPVRPPGDPAVVERGKHTFGANCGFCHGSDARGGSTGPNLVRSQLVLDDQHGELVGAVIREGRLAKGMPKFNMSEE